MKKLILTSRSGKTFTSDQFELVLANRSLTNDMFGVSCPSRMSPSQTMAWVDTIYRTRHRQMENLRALFEHSEQEFKNNTQSSSLILKD